MMNPSNNKSGVSRPRLTVMLVVALIVMYTVLIFLLGVRDQSKRTESLRFQALETARAYFNLIQIARTWNARHGGVFIRVKDGEEPNPYLDESERDVVFNDDIRCIRVNPAYMTRMLSDIARETGSLTFRLTSLKPVNPINAPDAWESRILAQFTGGKKEAYTEMQLAGEPYFRYMGPLVVKQECLVCHAKGGYKVGDIRGALTVNIPIKAQLALRDELDRQSMLEFLGVWVLTILIILLIALGYSRRLARAIKQEVEVEKLQTAMQTAGATAHELRQPLSVVIGYVELLKGKAVGDVKLEELTDSVVAQCLRMDDIIKKMLSITRIKTKDYAGGLEIMDFPASSEETPEDK